MLRAGPETITNSQDWRKMFVPAWTSLSVWHFMIPQAPSRHVFFAHCTQVLASPVFIPYASTWPQPRQAPFHPPSLLVFMHGSPTVFNESSESLNLCTSELCLPVCISNNSVQRKRSRDNQNTTPITNNPTELMTWTKSHDAKLAENAEVTIRHMVSSVRLQAS